MRVRPKRKTRKIQSFASIYFAKLTPKGYICETDDAIKQKQAIDSSSMKHGRGSIYDCHRRKTDHHHLPSQILAAQKTLNLILVLVICSVVMTINLSLRTNYPSLSEEYFSQIRNEANHTFNPPPRIVYHTFLRNIAPDFREYGHYQHPHRGKRLTGTVMKSRRDNGHYLVRPIEVQDSPINSEDALYTSFNLKGVILRDEENKGGAAKKTNDVDCVSMHRWQTTSYPTCNVMHEADMYHFIQHSNYNDEASEPAMKYLSSGGSRDVWKIYTKDLANQTTREIVPVVLKSLRLRDMTFDPKNYENQRRDVMAMERLTSSPHVIDIYNFCGQSMTAEFAKTNIAFVVRQTKLSSIQKLQIARDAALGLADAHSFDGEPHATLVHGDIKDQNFVLSADGKSVKLNDFNFAQFLTWDTMANTTCGRRKKICNLYRSPEECSNAKFTEKADVYALGKVLYFILTRKRPYTYPTEITNKEVEAPIVAGIRPTYPLHFLESKDPSVNTIMDAIEKCLEYDPDDRPSARQVANELDASLRRQKMENT